MRERMEKRPLGKENGWEIVTNLTIEEKDGIEILNHR
jgi:hypothetical protein